jgi:hypothetical protein
MGEGCGHGCDCSKEITTEDIVQNNNVILNTLIDLLIEKGVISEADLRKKLSELETEVETEEDEESEESEESGESDEEMDSEEGEELEEDEESEETTED